MLGVVVSGSTLPLGGVLNGAGQSRAEQFPSSSVKEGFHTNSGGGE